MGLENTLFESLPDVVTVKLDAVVNWARKSQSLAGDVRPGVLRDRDDEYGLVAERSFEIWSGDVSCVARDRRT